MIAYKHYIIKLSVHITGSEYHPLSFASRTIVVAWWFVVLVLISSYTAQLAASLTNDRISREINSVNDLTNQIMSNTEQSTTLKWKNFLILPTPRHTEVLCPHLETICILQWTEL